MKEKDESTEPLKDNNEEKKSTQEEIKTKSEENKEKLSNNQRQFNNDKKYDMNFYASQKHLFDRKAQKKNPLVNITKKSLQTEYISEVNYLLQKMIFIFFLSILIFVEDFLILRNYKLYTEVTLSQIFSAFTIFNSLFLLVELYREALRDQFRHNLFRLFSIFLCIFNICLFVSESMNIYTIYNKIQMRKEKCKTNKRYCGDKNINTIILVFNCIHIFGILFFANFPIWLGFRSLKILLGCDNEVYQKQLLELENENNDNKGKTDKKNKKDDSKKKKKEHLKKE